MEISVQIQLFVELLNYYVYFYERGNNNVSTNVVLRFHCLSLIFYIIILNYNYYFM